MDRHANGARTVAGKVGDGEGAGQLQLVVVGGDPGEDPLEHAALAPLKQLLHGLVCTQGVVGWGMGWGEGWRLVTESPLHHAIKR